MAHNFIIQEITKDLWSVGTTHGPFAEYNPTLDYAQDVLNLDDENFLVILLTPPRDKRTHIHPDQTTIDDYITNPDSGC